MEESANSNSILKKRISTYRSPKGYLKGLPDDLLIDIISMMVPII